MAGTSGGLLESVELIAAQDMNGRGAPAPGGGSGRQAGEDASRWDLSFSGGRLYGLSDASGSAARVRVRTRSTSVAVDLSRFGSDLSAEHAAAILVARPGAADLWGGGGASPLLRRCDSPAWRFPALPQAPLVQPFARRLRLDLEAGLQVRGSAFDVGSSMFSPTRMRKAVWPGAPQTGA